MCVAPAPLRAGRATLQFRLLARVARAAPWADCIATLISAYRSFGLLSARQCVRCDSVSAVTRVVLPNAVRLSVSAPNARFGITRQSCGDGQGLHTPAWARGAVLGRQPGRACPSHRCRIGMCAARTHRSLKPDPRLRDWSVRRGGIFAKTCQEGREASPLPLMRPSHRDARRMHLQFDQGKLNVTKVVLSLKA